MKSLNNVNIGKFQEIEGRLLKMVESKTINLDILSGFEIIRQDFDTIQDYWEGSEEVVIDIAFILYHYARNASAIVRRVMRRIGNAQIAHQNPQVAIDALDVLPSLLDTYEELINFDEEIIKRGEVFEKISQRNRTLRDIAEKAGFLPSDEEALTTEHKQLLVKEMETLLDDTYKELDLTIQELEDES